MLVSLVGFFYDTEKDEVVVAEGSNSFIIRHLDSLDSDVLKVISIGSRITSEAENSDLPF